MLETCWLRRRKSSLQAKEVHLAQGLDPIHEHIRLGFKAGVAEWQTRWTQNPVFSRMCGFKSHLRYFKPPKDLEWFSGGFFIRLAFGGLLPLLLPDRFSYACQMTLAAVWAFRPT